MPQSVVASCQVENMGLAPVLPRDLYAARSADALFRRSGHSSMMKESRRNEGVSMVAMGASRESSRSQMTMSLRPFWLARSLAAENARMRLPRPLTAWRTMKPPELRSMASLKVLELRT